MQKIVCQLLIVWLTFISGCANVHAINDSAAHDAEHASHIAQLNAPADTSELEAVDANHSDACIHVNCGHGSALLAQLGTSTVKNALVDVPAFQQRWVSHAIPSDIERPKWTPTTPAVVNLLG